MSDCSLIATRKSHAKHKKSAGRIPRVAERGQIRLLNFSASTSGNKKKENVCWRGTYVLFRWKQSMYSKPYANKNKLVTFLIPEHRQAKDYYAKDYKRSCFGSEIKGRNSWNLTGCTNTHDRLMVRNTSRICQKIIKPLSMRWTTTKEELHIKGMKWVAKGVKKL